METQIFNKTEIKTLCESLTKEEKSLILYIETRAVDHDSMIDTKQINATDEQILKKYHNEGWIKYGRVHSNHAIKTGKGMYVLLSDELFEIAAELRKQRAKRGMERSKELYNEARAAYEV